MGDPASGGFLADAVTDNFNPHGIDYEMTESLSDSGTEASPKCPSITSPCMNTDSGK